VNNRRNWEQGRRQGKRMREVEEEEYHNKQQEGYEKEKIQNTEGRKINKTWRWKMRLTRMRSRMGSGGRKE
jgi:hypothetical protein